MSSRLSWLSPAAARWLAVVGVVLGLVATNLLGRPGVPPEVPGLVVVAGCVLAALGGYRLPVPAWARGRPLVPAGVVGVLAAVEWWAPMLSHLLPGEGRATVAALLPALAVALGKVSEGGQPLPSLEEAGALLEHATQPNPAAIGPAAALEAAQRAK